MTMKSQDKRIVQVLELNRFYLKTLGLISFSIDDLNQKRHPKQSLIAKLFHSVCVLFSSFLVISYYKWASQHSLVTFLTAVFNLCALGLVILTCILWSHICKKTIYGTFQALLETDGIFEQHNINPDYKHLKTVESVLYLIHLGGLAVRVALQTIQIMLYHSQINFWMFIPFMAILAVFQMFLMLLNLQFIFVFLTVKVMFQELERALVKKIYNIEVYAELHLNLSKIVREYAKMLSVLMWMLFGMAFVVITLTAYRQLGNIEGAMSSNLGVQAELLDLTVLCFGIGTNIVIGQLLENSAASFKSQLLRLTLIDHKKPRSRLQAKTLCLQILHNEVKITPSGLFNVNFTFVWQDIMSRSCTLPGRPLQNRRKLSIHDMVDGGERPPSPPGSARSEALQRIADIVRRTGVTLDQDETAQPTDSYIEDLRFNNSIREIFLNRFVHIFQSYENFVIFPNQDKEDWFNNRDSMQNFDKASFLSDQPEQHRLFLWRFLESQMFATLIDNKILSTWGEEDNNLVIFDNRIKLLKQRYGGENLIRSLCYEPCTVAHDTQKLLERRLTNPDFESPSPKEILNTKPNPSRYFPLLDKEILNKTPVVNKGSIPRASAFRKGLAFARHPHLAGAASPGQTDKAKSGAGNGQDMSPALIAQANWTFVEKLLKDSKAKTKRMLLAKLGAEGVTLSSNTTTDNFGAVEESTLVAALCEFLERVWSHGLQRKRGKSALWSHLLAYQEIHQKIDNQYLSPVEMSQLAMHLENWSRRGESKNMRTDLPPLPKSILFDIVNVQAMTDVKTGIGMAKAWVRLALEKKQLSKHLRTLLSDQGLLRGQYKRSAFLRCEEEKEQFLYHLLSLNAVDYFCFTSTYPTTVIPYHIVIVPNKKGATTSANAWVVLSGTLSETRRIPVPKSTLNFQYKHQNVGVLTTLRIGHDNTGLYAKWMVDYVLVRNDLTGHTYKFPCGRWLGRGVDDGSTERLLVGNLMASQVENEEVGHTGSIGHTPPRTRSPGPPPRTELKPSQIQHMLGDCVNNIVKWHYRRTSERHTTLTALLCGDNGLVHCLESVFLLGFKSARLFVGKHYLWDYFVRVKEQFENELLEESSGNRSASLERNHQETVAVWRCYCHLVEEIMCTSNALGKDGKFQLFICLSVREHLLHRMLVPMASCKVTLEMYEESSFLRNRGLLTFLRQILLPLDELDVVLENSVTHGISSPSPHV